MRLRRRALLFLPLLLGCTVITVNCTADRLIVGENHETIDPAGARRQMIQVNGRQVECWVARSPGGKAHEPQAYVLFFFGKEGRVDEWITRTADAWENKPVELWGMNYPGSGGSEGPVEAARVGPDALALYDHVAPIAGSRPIFVEGASFGTAVSLSVAARRPVAGVIMKTPAPMRQLILGAYGWWNLWLLAGPVAAHVPAHLDSISNAAQCKAPAIIILAGADFKIPPKYQRMVVDAYAGPRRLIEMPSAGHDSGLTQEAIEALKADMDWMWRLAVPRAPGAADSLTR
jgi:pimeloyl-ACP methyl ester carboxylesterase